MASPGIRDLYPLLASTLATMSISDPTTTPSTVRILKSTDPTYGAVGWTPFQNPVPFVVLIPGGVSDSRTTEPFRAHADYMVQWFTAIEHSSTPGTVINYEDLAYAWMDQHRQVCASNYALRPSSTTLFPTAGDVRWMYQGSHIETAYRILGSTWYGVLASSLLHVTVSVNYQF